METEAGLDVGAEAVAWFIGTVGGVGMFGVAAVVFGAPSGAWEFRAYSVAYLAVVGYVFWTVRPRVYEVRGREAP